MRQGKGVCKVRLGDGGLSPLQRTMLRMAAGNRRAPRAASGPRNVEGVDLYYAEVLADVFKWPVPPGTGPGNLRHRSDALSWSPGSLGQERYRSDIEAVVVAMADLHARGMLVAWQGQQPLWTELTLTNKGLATADRLAAAFG
jgi:hypothetical protein